MNKEIAMGKPLILALSLLLFLTGCTHIISEKSLERADPTVTFGKLRENPDDYRGKFVILGGAIVGVTHTREGRQLEVVQYPLDSTEMPDTTSDSEGRFLVILPHERGYVAFNPGMLVTMAGEVVGKVVKPLAGAEYVYPAIVVREIHIIVTHPAYRYP
jgi:outer membrane lipoprotein